MPGDERILVIKHGALGDWVLATGCFAAIRRHHRSAHVTLLTTPAFADLGARCPWFDEVWTDERATCAVGNDTGPVHVAATAGCPTVVLFGEGSEPERSAPCGEAVTVIRRVPLASLAVEDVFNAAQQTWGSA